MRILIVDDERLVRISLESMLLKIDCDSHILQVRNSEQMEKILRETAVDLIFLDINMPGISGLEAMERFSSTYPDVDWCILTGYGYFDYAKKAIDLGAKGYLLKPPDPEELKKFMEQITCSRQEIVREKQRQFTEELRRAIDLEDFSDMKGWGQKQSFVVCTFFADSGCALIRQDIVRKIYQKLKAYAKESSTELFAVFAGVAAGICVVADQKETVALKAFLCDEDEREWKDVFLSGLYSRICGVEECGSAIKLQGALAPLRLFGKNREVLGTQEWNRDPLVLKKQYFGVRVENLLAIYTSGDIAGLREELVVFHREVEMAGETQVTNELRESLGVINGFPFTTDSVEHYFGELLEALIREKTGMKLEEELIIRICTYVRQHYMEDLSIDAMGEQFSITPTYLSHYFRKKTGEKYIDYVTGIRMEKAKEFLQTHRYTMKEVSSRVGYSSEKHFSRTFKKFWGINPSEIEIK